jgi:arabinofuranan 3-O-arabinosyltransferase
MPQARPAILPAEGGDGRSEKGLPWAGVLTPARLQLYGYAIAAIYAAFLLSVYHAKTWIVGPDGEPIYTDFACAWIAGVQALRGQITSLYDPARFVEIQAAFVGPSAELYPNWPYPPTFLLILAPFAALRYLYAFLTWDLATLVGCVAVVWAVTRHPAAIALVLAWPFTAWNFLAAQNGFLTAALFGASLLFLERHPILSGIFIGCLRYKPQFGVLIPVALVAAKLWRTTAAAGITALLLASASAVAFGVGAWTAFPQELAAQVELNLLAGPDSNWGNLQSVYGVIRSLHGSAALAWLAQGAVTVGTALIVWFVWRSSVRFALKATTLSAAALIASPYAFAYDMAATVIPAAFLVRDQLSHGSFSGERPMAVVVFAFSLAALITFGDWQGGITFGSAPVGIFVALTILSMILRRTLAHS